MTTTRGSSLVTMHVDGTRYHGTYRSEALARLHEELVRHGRRFGQVASEHGVLDVVERRLTRA